MVNLGDPLITCPLSFISLVVSRGLLTIIVNFITPSLFILVRQINDGDNDDDDDDD